MIAPQPRTVMTLVLAAFVAVAAIATAVTGARGFVIDRPRAEERSVTLRFVNQANSRLPDVAVKVTAIPGGSVSTVKTDHFGNIRPNGGAEQYVVEVTDLRYLTTKQSVRTPARGAGTTVIQLRPLTSPVRSDPPAVPFVGGAIPLAPTVMRSNPTLVTSEARQVIFMTNRRRDAASATGFSDQAVSKNLSTGTVRVAITRTAVGARQIDRYASGTPSPDAPLDDLIPARSRILLYLPGVRSSFDRAIAEAAQVADRVRHAGIVAVFAWASSTKAGSFGVEESASEAAAAPLGSCLDRLAARGVVPNVIARGLSSRMTLSALLHATTVPRLLIEELVLVAPDAEVESFNRGWSEVRRAVGSLTIYASRHDVDLIAAETSQAYRRLGDGRDPFLDLKNASLVLYEGSTSITSFASYRQEESLYRDIRTVLSRVGQRLRRPASPPVLRHLPR